MFRVRHSSGFASILALVFLAVFSALAIALMAAANGALLKADNQAHVQNALLASESGLAFYTYELQHIGMSGSLRGQAMLDSLASKLRADLNGKANLGGGTVGYDSTAITVPPISLDGGKSFTAQITLTAPDRLHLIVKGQVGAGAGGGGAAVSLQRQVGIDFHPTWDQAIGFGLCSRGPVEMGMNTDLSGVSQPSDGSIYSASSGVAISCGSGHISGDVTVSDPNAQTALGGTTVDGVVRKNAPPVTMPQIDRSSYKSLATNVMNSSSPPTGIYKNIRIPANTNPTFGGGVTLLGVIYIEAPNKVYFNNSVSFTGVMVADDPPAGSPDSDNYIYFNNNMTFKGPEHLPDTPEFTDVKKFQGSAILCPGFTMEFKNNMTSVGGIMALKALTAKNNVDSTLYGSLLIYGNVGLDFKNNSDLNISLSGSSPPVGFTGHGLPPLMPDPTTYVER
jgi:hypothetical protein